MMHLMTLQKPCSNFLENDVAAAKVPLLKGNLPSIKCFAMYKAQQKLVAGNHGGDMFL